MKLPPYAELLGLRIEQDAHGEPVLTMPFGDDVLGRPGFLHGGAIGGLLEMAAIVSLQHALEGEGEGGGEGEGEGEGGAKETARIKPINVTLDFMRGGREKATWAKATVTRLGNRVANVDAVAWQDDPAKPIARGRLNYLIVRA